MATSILTDLPAIEERQLNITVQQTIDRIVFLRMCEDRGIEEYGRLQRLIGQGDVYKSLTAIFEDADDRYNSGLFHFHRDAARAEQEDKLSLQLNIDDSVLDGILRRLYFPESPYEFSVLPSEILGQVYERFLGHVLRITGSDVSLEQKPEVRKAGGVYYTPTAVVQYIVDQTLAPLLDGATPKRAAEIKILDPACGSGSFLLVAYDALLTWHRDFYVNNPMRGQTRLVYEGPGGEWRLTIAERKRILLNSIFGVDIDPQAVETTKLSLLLKVLEHESSETVGRNLQLFRQRALPDLGRNIKSGNSLVSGDFYEQARIAATPETDWRVNPFDWRAEFPDVFQRRSGGFDVVLGNPPYVFGEYLDELTKRYIQNAFALAKRQFDTYALFVEQAFRLAGKSGYVSMVIPDAVLARDMAAATRKQILDNGLLRVFHCGQVFEANVSAVVFVSRKGSSPPEVASDVPAEGRIVEEHACKLSRFLSDPDHRLLVHASDSDATIISLMQASELTVGDVVDVSRGEELGKGDLLEDGVLIVIGEDIKRFVLDEPSRHVYEATKSDLIYAAPKVVVVKTGSQVVAALDETGWVTMQSVYNLAIRDGDTDPAALIGVLNSRLVRYFVWQTFTAYKLLFPQLKIAGPAPPKRRAPCRDA